MADKSIEAAALLAAATLLASEAANRSKLDSTLANMAGGPPSSRVVRMAKQILQEWDSAEANDSKIE